MTDSTCSIDGCGRPVATRGWCRAHYSRWYKHGDPYCGGPIRSYSSRTFEEAFRHHMPGEPPESGCWLWTGAVDKDGYGVFQFEGRPVRAHVAAYRLYVGAIPKGAVVRHGCDRVPCCQPKCLTIGTQKQNIQDKVERGRQAIGERIGTALLTADQVREIRRAYAAGGTTQGALAELFGVSRPTIQAIVLRRNWKHVE